MQKTINEVLQLINSLKSNTYETPVKLQWINEVDGAIWTELMQYKKTEVIPLQEGVSVYALPEGATFTRIERAYLNGDDIPKISNSQYKTTGILRGVGDTAIVYPVPKDGELAIVYLEEFIPHKAEDVITDKVLAESPFDKIYIAYISAMIDFTRREYGAYNNDLNLFNAAFIEYAEWLVKNGAIERREWNCVSLLQNLQKISKSNQT